MRDDKAVELSQFVSALSHELSKAPEWSQNELLILIREVLALKAKTVKEEKDIL